SPAAPSCTSRRSSPPERPPPGRGRPTSQERTRRTPTVGSLSANASTDAGRRACSSCPRSVGSGTPSGTIPCAARCSASTPPPVRTTSTPRPSRASPSLSHALEGGDTDRVLPVVGGGAVSAPWRRILADVTGRPVLLADGTDATLLGAAIAGADALGLDHGIASLVEQAVDLTAPEPSA